MGCFACLLNGRKDPLNITSPELIWRDYLFRTTAQQEKDESYEPKDPWKFPHVWSRDLTNALLKSFVLP
jgi:hypothetical protein